jgi:hypothetical protein
MSAIFAAGCQSKAPPPARVNVPQYYRQGGPVTSYEPMRPLRSGQEPVGVPAPLYDDVPLIAQAPPEQQAFSRAYAAVGKPRIVVFVNRGFDGAIVPVTQQRTLVGVDVRREASAAVDVERRETASGVGRMDMRVREETVDSFRSTGPGTYREISEVYLAPGQYDEVQAQRIDYDAIENVLTDWFSAGGKVTLVSADMARQRLTEDEVKELQSGRPTALRDIAKKLDADVLIQAQAKPTRQTEAGLEVRVLVEAINVPKDNTGGESLARAFVDVPPPLEKTTINKYTRFLARKVMSQLTQSWEQQSATPGR